VHGDLYSELLYPCYFSYVVEECVCVVGCGQGDDQLSEFRRQLDQMSAQHGISVNKLEE